MVDSTNVNDAKIAQYNIMLEENEMGNIQWKDTQMQLIHVIKRHGKGSFNRKDMDRYFTTQYYQ